MSKAIWVFVGFFAVLGYMNTALNVLPVIWNMNWSDAVLVALGLITMTGYVIRYTILDAIYGED